MDTCDKRALSSEEPSLLPSSEKNTKSESQRENIGEIEDEIQSLNLEETQNSKKRPLWAIKTIEAAQDFVAPSKIIRESKRPKRFSSHTKNMIDLSKIEPINPSDAIKHTS